MHYRVVRQKGYRRLCRLDYGIVCGTVTPERRRKRDIPSDRDITTLRQDDTVTYAYMRIGLIYFNLLFQGFSFTVIYSGNDNELRSLVRMTGLKRPCTRLTPRKEANIPVRKNVIAVTPDQMLPTMSASRITMPVHIRNTPMNIPLIPNTVRGISRFLCTFTLIPSMNIVQLLLRYILRQQQYDRLLWPPRWNHYCLNVP